ncbi:hypothetical protein NQ314_014228 [Rhamnusium bicolor]|uniref:Reverse transcriptase domain-containing protein n=1 Tax=Rhamnusium bicolor TaxID=1586634 RepID=A0AAV8X2U3_9CUCU|nr:hypothetical protein NQ314_014228 [Rhamnusium bicolor]
MEKILEWVKGYKIPFLQKPLQQAPVYSKIKDADKKDMNQAISLLLKQGAIVSARELKDQFLSPYFLIKKPNGKNRFILNLKQLNEFIETRHFKMEDFRTVTKLIQRNGYMVTLDLKDAYFLISVDPNDRKYLRFKYNNVLYEFTCAPFGLAPIPYVFTKLLKPVIAWLHLCNISCSIYLDDLIIFGESEQECEANAKSAYNILEYLGFIINFEKSSLTSRRRCTHLGFIFDSENLTIELTLEKGIRYFEQ